MYVRFVRRGGVEVLVHANADNGDNCDRVIVVEVRPRLSSYRVTQAGDNGAITAPTHINYSVSTAARITTDYRHPGAGDGRRAENVRKPRSSGQRLNLNQPRPHFWIIFDELAGARAGARQGYCRDHQRLGSDLQNKR